MAQNRHKGNMEVLVSVADDYMGRIHDVSKGLKTAGLKVDQVMEEIGTITGSASRSKLAALQRVEGVAAVEQSRSVQLPPPESDVQ
jgi:hypothetical protein